MFCTKCGKELNANNVCVNEACPAYISNHSNFQYSNRNYSYTANFLGQAFGINENFRDENGISSIEMASFIGDNTFYFMDKWISSQKNRNFISWNWPTLFLNFIWFWHRKMYGIGIAVFFATIFIRVLAFLLAGAVAFFPSLYPLRSLIFIFIPISYLAPIVPAMVANQLYIKYATKKILKIKSLHSSNINNSALLEELRLNGGTASPFITILILFGTFVAFIFLVAFISTILSMYF